jgi:hypothetical protein
MVAGKASVLTSSWKESKLFGIEGHTQEVNGKRKNGAHFRLQRVGIDVSRIAGTRPPLDRFSSCDRKVDPERIFDPSHVGILDANATHQVPRQC